ncbi:MAG: peptidogalycan biosysnthesis protein, partial [Allorhizobium sp.]
MADEVTIRVVRSFKEIASAEWGELTGASRSAPGYNPFTSFAFLSSVEESGSATAETGWMGHHLLLEEEGRLIGAIPCYLKSHSQGEYVFDHGWADAFHRAGGSYYPKLQASIPFTPATGPRLLVRQGEDVGRVQSLLAQGLEQVCRELGTSSAHVTFLPQGELPALKGAGFLQRTDQQFHFINRGYADHEAFLAEL